MGNPPNFSGKIRIYFFSVKSVKCLSWNGGIPRPFLYIFAWQWAALCSPMKAGVYTRTVLTILPWCRNIHICCFLFPALLSCSLPLSLFTEPVTPTCDFFRFILFFSHFLSFIFTLKAYSYKIQSWFKNIHINCFFLLFFFPLF